MRKLLALLLMPLIAQAGDAALFDPVASVVMGPRCINCHQADAPRQKDWGVIHAQQVVRPALIHI